MRDIKIATSAAEFAKGGFFLESFILPLPRRLILLARVKFPFATFSSFKFPFATFSSFSFLNSLLPKFPVLT